MKEYNIKEITPKNMRCAAAMCPSIYEITPEDMRCAALACPSIYEITPEDMRCGIAACSGIYEEKGNYLIIGTKVSPKDFGLEKKVGEGEILIEVPKKLIDEKGNWIENPVGKLEVSG